MRRFSYRFWVLLTLTVSLLLLNACTRKHPDDSQIPWARPAGWENSGPGGFGLGTPTPY